MEIARNFLENLSRTAKGDGYFDKVEEVFGHFGLAGICRGFFAHPTG